MEEENKSITLKDICKTIWVRKWVALIVAVLVMLVCAISINYIYNPHVQTYKVEFSLNLPGSDTNAFYSYPDGKLFHYSELTSAETLEEIKNSGDFENINIEQMVSKRDINITRTITTTATALEVNPYKEVNYTLIAKSRYFRDENQARDFLVCVASYPTEYLENMDINYDLPASDNNTLKEQLKFLVQQYGELMETYGKTYVANGKTLFYYSQEVTAYLGPETLTTEGETSSTTTEEKTYSVDEVKKFTKTFESTSKAVYSKAASVAFTQSGIIVVSGGLKLSVIVLLSVVLGVVIALIAAYVAGYLALKKKQASAEAASSVAPKEQPAAEAEATEKENKE